MLLLSASLSQVAGLGLKGSVVLALTTGESLVEGKPTDFTQIPQAVMPAQVVVPFRRARLLWTPLSLKKLSDHQNEYGKSEKR